MERSLPTKRRKKKEIEEINSHAINKIFQKESPKLQDTLKLSLGEK